MVAVWHEGDDDQPSDRFSNFLKTIRTRNSDGSPISWEQHIGLEPSPDDTNSVALLSPERLPARLPGTLPGKLPGRALSRPKAPVRDLPLLWAKDAKPRLKAGGTLVKDLLDEGSMSVIYGPSNVGKSFFVLDLAFHIAAQWEWRGHKIKQAGCVLYIAAEGGYGIANRIAALKLHHGLAEDNDVPLAVIPCPVNLLDPEADIPNLLRLMDDVEGQLDMPVILVIVDTLSRAMVGGDENGAPDMSAFVANVDRIRQEGPHVLIVHHSGKDVAKGARGHSSLRAAIDTEIELKPGSAGKEGVATVVKQRDMPGGEIFAFDLLTVELGADEDGDPVASAVVVHLDQPSSKPKGNEGDGLVTKARHKQLLEMAEKVLAARGDEHTTDGGEVVRAAKVGDWRAALLDSVRENDRPSKRKEFDRDIADLEDNKGAIVTSGERHAKLFWLPTTMADDGDEEGDGIA
jgi:hypothetical protein